MVAAVKPSKSATTSTSKKTVKAVEPTVKESPTRLSRRSAPAKSPAKKASPSPSPAPKKKKVTAAAVKKSNKTDELEEEKEEKFVAKSVPLISKPAKSSGKNLIRAYLIIYNTLSAFAWAFLLFNLAKSFFFDHPNNSAVLFKKTGYYLAYLQTVALLEVLHAAFGWVRSGVMSNVIQIASRLFVIWVAGVFGGSGKHWAYGMMSVAWALSDFTRYAYYLTQLTETSVPVLKWARYNFFLVLYPVGTLGEAILIFLTRMKFSKNLPISYGLLTVLAIYTPGFLYMYSHMLHQRSKHFGLTATTNEAGTTSKQRKVKSK